eukprot:m.242622 g.242622  ORF g.242622 m.242622 type:complete len:240 (-) comp14073_c0_seq1:93-812(-)
MSLHVYATKDLAAQALCGFILRVAAQSITSHGHFSLAISGGSLPALLQGLRDANTDWGKWLVFLSDERVVPLDHADSNYKAIQDAFLSKVPVPASNVFAITPGLDASHAAADYESRLLAALGQEPALDLVLLGMGPDGHTCSLFPGHALLQEKSKWIAYLEDSPKPPPARITLTLRALTAAKNVAFACLGESKAAMVQQVLDPKTGPSLPSGVVNAARPDVHWFLDQPAAALVQPKSDL